VKAEKGKSMIWCGIDAKCGYYGYDSRMAWRLLFHGVSRMDASWRNRWESRYLQKGITGNYITLNQDFCLIILDLCLFQRSCFSPSLHRYAIIRSMPVCTHHPHECFNERHVRHTPNDPRTSNTTLCYTRKKKPNNEWHPLFKIPEPSHSPYPSSAAIPQARSSRPPHHYHHAHARYNC